MVWINNDGLRVRFEHEKIDLVAPRGEAPGAGETRTIDVLVDLTKTTAATPYLIYGDVTPRNSFIQKVEATVVKAITGASALTFGLQHYDGTEYDYDGFITALPALTAGTEVSGVKGGTGAGVLVGTELAYPGLLTCTTTGTATGGLVSLRVHVFVADKDQTNKFNP